MNNDFGNFRNLNGFDYNRRTDPISNVEQQRNMQRHQSNDFNIRPASRLYQQQQQIPRANGFPYEENRVNNNDRDRDNNYVYGTNGSYIGGNSNNNMNFNANMNQNQFNNSFKKNAKEIISPVVKNDPPLKFSQSNSTNVFQHDGPPSYKIQSSAVVPSSDEFFKLKNEVAHLKNLLSQYEKSDKEKSETIEKQKKQIERLHRENFDLKAKVNIQKRKEEEEKLNQRTSRGDSRRTGGNQNERQREIEEMKALQYAMELQEEEIRREPQTEQQQYAVIDPSFNEEQLLRQAIEESKKDNPVPENMSYEQLLELGDRIGKVSKGLTKQQISKIPCRYWRPGLTKQNNCSICFEDFGQNQKIKMITSCGHEYHDNCIDKWLDAEKRCPVCNKPVQV